MRKLLVASTNKGKVAEFGHLFRAAWSSVEIVDLGSLTKVPAVEETGDTFFDNAYLKAEAYSKFSGLPTIADDSGLCVDHLQGRPGVRSARYAGSAATDRQNIERVLEEMQSVAQEKRSAHFTCALVLYFPDGTYLSAQEDMHGAIHDRSQGTNGFGYDPIFWLPDFQKTLAELSNEEKNKISHRRKALDSLMGKLPFSP